MAALSKIFAVATTYPYQVVRARLQDQHSRYDGVIDVIRRTWRYGADPLTEDKPRCFRLALWFTFITLSPSLQERRRHRFLQRDHPQRDPRHSRLLHHLCSLWECVWLPSETKWMRPTSSADTLDLCGLWMCWDETRSSLNCATKRSLDCKWNVMKMSLDHRTVSPRGWSMSSCSLCNKLMWKSVGGLCQIQETCQQMRDWGWSDNQHLKHKVSLCCLSYFCGHQRGDLFNLNTPTGFFEKSCFFLTFFTANCS